MIDLIITLSTIPTWVIQANPALTVVGGICITALGMLVLMLVCSCGRVKAEIHQHEAQDLAEQINKDYNDDEN